MLIINEHDIEEAVNADQLVGAIERAYSILDDASTQIPDRMHLNASANTLLVMPGWIDSISGTKLVTVFPENAKHNKATINGLVVLNHPQTGEPVACINGSKLTAMRTAAVGATAVKYLAPDTVKTLGIIGTGVQAWHQALIVSTQRSFKKLLICGRNQASAEQMKASLKNQLDIDIELMADANQLVLDSDVIITATTSSEPVFNLNAEQLYNKTFIGIGSYRPTMCEMPTTLLEVVDQVYVDTPLAKTECGDIKIPLESGLIQETDVVPFADLITGKASKTEVRSQYFKSVGMALFDLTVGELIYTMAVNKKLGTEIKV